MQEAASLLALCSGTAGAGKVTRNFFFRSPILAKPVQVQLQDDPLDNHDYSSVGAQTWGGACVLSADIVEHPERFGLSSSSHQIMDIPVNSVGGTTLACFGAGSWDGLDFYPSVLANLERNITQNFASTLPTQVRVESAYLDWSECSQNTQRLLPPLDTPFDVVFGADIIYEELHARWIKGCLERLLKRPQPGASSRTIPAFHLVIPLRKTHAAESRTIEDVFTFAGAGCNGEVGEDDAEAMELCITRKEIITCDGGDGSDDVDYVYYCIQWS
ncbi:hypothetical protein ONZ45_g5164 [Pleurotus djamor]|nr:hypothetical protein ONZ45_g5164 [Pleurotus djamor]